MKVSSSKEKILKKIREALSNPVPLPFPKSEGSAGVFPGPDKDLEILFAEEFVKLSGKFAFCFDEQDAINQLHLLITQRKWTKVFSKEKEVLPFFNPSLLTDDLQNCDVAITSCHHLVARTGSMVLSSKQQHGRTTSVYAPLHICMAYTDQLVFDTKDALKSLKETFGNLPSSVTFAAGPSRTADIEKTLVIGIHGPKEVYVFLIDRQNPRED
ncbi:MAG: LUD domain-containing protein [Ginsengibacter sp.]